MTTKIVTSINIGYKTNFITFEEQSQSYSMMANQKDTIKYVKEFGANVIQVYADNNPEDLLTHLNRVARVAKTAGYINNVTVKEIFEEMDNIKHEWIEISGQFVKEGGN